MNATVSFFKRYPLAVFFTIAYATSFIGGYLDSLYPDKWAILVYGPLFGALIVTAVTEGRRGLKAWLSRIVRWRVGVQWYIVALFLPIVLQLAALGLNSLLGTPLPTAAQWASWTDVLPQFVFIFLFIGLAEEPGFRGFALHRLLEGRTAVSATLILGVLHTIWHLPLFLNGSEGLRLIPHILAGAFVFTWIYLGTGNSALLAMIFHSVVNTCRIFFESILTEAAFEQQQLLLMALYVVFALVLVIVNGPQLIRKVKPVMQPASGLEG